MFSLSFTRETLTLVTHIFTLFNIQYTRKSPGSSSRLSIVCDSRLLLVTPRKVGGLDSTSTDIEETGLIRYSSSVVISLILVMIYLWQTKAGGTWIPVFTGITKLDGNDKKGGDTRRTCYVFI